MNAPSKRAMRLLARKNHITSTATTDGRTTRSDTGAPARPGTAAITRSVAGATAPRREASTRQQQTPDPSAALPVIEELSPTEIAEFIDTVTAVGTGDGDELDPTLWGPSPSTAETTRAHLVNLAAKFADRRTVLAQSITRAQAAQLLGISDQAVSDRLTAGDLVGLKDGRVWRLPTWQFDADTANGWLPGISQLRTHFPGGPVTLTTWATTPNVDLGDQTPAARLAAGDVDQVLLASRAAGPTARKRP